MRFGICSTWNKKKTIEEIIEFAKGLSLDGIEIWDGHIDEYIYRNGCSVKNLKKLLDEKGLLCSAIAPYFNLLDGEQRKVSIDSAEKCVNYARELDCRIIRTFVGSKPSRDVNDKEWEGVIEALKYMTAMVENSSIDFALETHYNQPTDRVENILNIIEKTKNTHLKVLFDGFNYFVDGFDMLEAYERLKDYIVHYHLKNYFWEDRVCKPLNAGDVDFAPLLGILKENAYKGFISFEYFCKDPEAIIKESLDWIKLI